jgi:hypothetical protein
MSEKDKLLIALVKEVLKKRKREKKEKNNKKSKNTHTSKKSKNNDNYTRQNRGSQEMPRGYIVNQGDNRFNPAVMANNNFSNELRMQNDILQQNTRKMIDDRVNDINSRNQRGFEQLNNEYQSQFNQLADYIQNKPKLGNNPYYLDDEGYISEMTQDEQNDEHTSQKDPFFVTAAKHPVPTAQGSDTFISDFDRQQGDALQLTNGMSLSEIGRPSASGPPQPTATPQISPPKQKPTQLFPKNPPSTNSLPYTPQLSTKSNNSNKIIPVSTNGHQNDIDDSKSDVSDVTLPTFDGTYDARSNFTPDEYFDTIHKYFDHPDVYKDEKNSFHGYNPMQNALQQKTKKDKATAPPPDVFVEDVEDEEDKKPVEVKKIDENALLAKYMTASTMKKEDVIHARTLLHAKMPDYLKDQFPDDAFNKVDHNIKRSIFSKMKIAYKKHVEELEKDKLKKQAKKSKKIKRNNII